MNIFGYGCFPVGAKDPYRSTVYKSLRGQFLPKENIVLDSMGDRTYLFELMDRCMPDDAIVIMNRRTLGNTTEFRQLWKELIYNRRINLLIIDENSDSRVDYYSSCDFSFVRFPDNIIEEKWQRLQKEVFERQSNKIGRKNAAITSRFKEVYWYYQSFLIKVDEAYSSLGISKPTFYALSKEYETTQDYIIELERRTELHDIAKRGGVTKEIDMLLMNVERVGMSIKDACQAVGIPDMTELEYKRYKLAKEGGRKEQFRLEAERYQPNYLKTH